MACHGLVEDVKEAFLLSDLVDTTNISPFPNTDDPTHLKEQ